MQYQPRAPRRALALLLLPMLAAASIGAPADAPIGSGATEQRADNTERDAHKWSGTGPKGASERNINIPATGLNWQEDLVTVNQATGGETPSANGIPDAVERMRSRIQREADRLAGLTPPDTSWRDALNGIKGQRIPDDAHPVEFNLFLKTLNDDEAVFVRPPPNKIQIVDQEALKNMSQADKDKLNVKYRKTVIIPRIVHYKPIYKTIEVAYPG